MSAFSVINPLRLTQFCDCGSKADIGFSNDESGTWDWVCRACLVRADAPKGPWEGRCRTGVASAMPTLEAAPVRRPIAPGEALDVDEDLEAAVAAAGRDEALHTGED